MTRPDALDILLPLPYDSHMARTQTMVQLSDDLLADLDREAARKGVSRSALIRDAVTASLAASRDTEVSRAIIEGYRRIPQGIPDEWGDLAAMTEATFGDLMKRLDAEEREHGFPPW